METRASSNRFVPWVTKLFRETLVEETPRPAARAGAALRRLGEFLARGLAAARAFCARVLRLADARHVSALRIKARAASVLDAAVKPFDHFITNVLPDFNNFMAREKSFGRSINRGLTSLLTAGAVGLGSFLPTKGGADLVRVGINTDGSNPNLEGSSMFLRNMEGGELGGDLYDAYWAFISRPPGSPPIWLRVYSDQVNQFYGISGYEQKTDARPYSGPDANKNFPLRADVQGLGEGETISANNCYFTFQAQNGYGTGGGYRDEGLRDLYAWTLSLDPSYAQFTDGSYSKSGVFDLREGPTHSTPAFNIWNVPGNTAFLEFDLLPIPEPGTAGILIFGAVGGGILRRLRRKAVAL